MTYAALASSVPAVILVWFMPNHKLPSVSPLLPIRTAANFMQ